MTYATVDDVQACMTRELSEAEQGVCETLLEQAAGIIDALAYKADECNKATVSCRMVVRALGTDSSMGIPIGATQGSQSALGYSQSWTVSGGASVGELYISKLEKQLLGIVSNKIGSHSPVEDISRCGHGWNYGCSL